jgi:hypothetical protein
MKTRITSLTFLAFVALGAVSAAQKKNAPDYYPMRPGSTWTYDSKTGDVQVRQKATVTKRVKTREGDEATIEWRVNDQVVQTEVYRITPSVLLRLEGGAGAGGRLTPPVPILKYPPKPGSKWAWQGTVSSMGVTVAVKSKISIKGPFTIKTPAGTFKNVLSIHNEGTMTLQKPDKSSRLPSQNRTLAAGWQGQAAPQAGPQTISYVSDFWLAPNVGLVQQKFVIGPQTIEGQLSSYKLK